MATLKDRNRLRQVQTRMTVKREDMARLRKELGALHAEAKELREKLAAEKKTEAPEVAGSGSTGNVFSGSKIFGLGVM